MQTGWVETRAGAIFWRAAGSGLRSALLLHGNSGDSEIFARQLAAVPDGWRFVAVDLAGHGKSSNAAVPERDYTLSGHADYLATVTASLKIEQPVLFGFSLGGHIALELLDRIRGVAGLILLASPPFRKSAEGLAAAFLPGGALGIATRAPLTDAEVARFAELHGNLPGPDQDKLKQAIARSDGVSRQVLGASLLRPDARDQLEIATVNTVPTAVAVGADDPMVSASYLNSLRIGGLWRNRVEVFPAGGHAVQMTQASAFNALLSGFLADLSHDGPHS